VSAVASTAPSSALSSAPTVRVLVVEDNLADARYLEETLLESEASYHCTHAEDLRTARELLADGSFDVVLLDLSLPDSSGLDSVRAIRECDPRTPCIVLTGTRDDRLALQAVQAGAHDFVEKGSEARLLRRSIRYAIERRRAEEDAVARAQAEENARKASVLAEATRVFNEKLDEDWALDNLAAIAIPLLGDYGWIEVVRSDRTERRAQHPRQSGERLASRNLLALPLRTREGVSAVLSIVRAETKSDFSTADIALAEDLVGRAAIAVENARVHREVANAARARQDMIATVSHDLRNPLSVVALTLGRLRGMPEVVERAGGSLDRAQVALSRVNRLLDDLLEIARIEAGALNLACERTWPAELVADAVNLHRPLADQRGIDLRVASGEDLPAVSVDRHRVGQVLSNLIGNALKFTPSGRSVEVSAHAAGACVCFVVADTGPGIPADQLPRLFDRFYRAPGVKESGTGLGLAIVKGIVEAHGGTVRAESELGRGTRMLFEIPMA
jgi:signal transduction histidine kinase